MQQQIKNEWDLVASNQNLLKDPFESDSRNIVDEAIEKEIGNVRGKDILDVGCGNGDFAYKLYDKGASVIGVDISEEMHKRAKAKYPMLDIRVIDFSHPEIKIDKKFDFVILELVIMFVKDVDGLLKNIRKVLNENGEVVVALIHPFFILSLKEKEDEAGLKVDGFDDYFVEQVLKLKSETVDFTYFSRSVSWYTKKFLENGFIVNDIAEPENIEGKISMIPSYESVGKSPYIMIYKLGLKK